MKHSFFLLFLVIFSDAFGQDTLLPSAVRIYYAPGVAISSERTKSDHDYNRGGYAWSAGLGFSRNFRNPRWQWQADLAFTHFQPELHNRSFQLEEVADPNNADTTYSVRNTHRYLEIPFHLLYVSPGEEMGLSNRFSYGLGGGFSVGYLLEERAVWKAHPLGEKGIDNFRNERIGSGSLSMRFFLTVYGSYTIGTRSQLFFEIDYSYCLLPDSQRTLTSNNLFFHSARVGYAWRF